MTKTVKYIRERTIRFFVRNTHLYFNPCHLPGTAYLLASGKSKCPSGEEITNSADCEEAFNSIKTKYGLNNKRSMQVGSWNHVPLYCTVQRPGDDTVHFNKNSNPSTPRGYRKICKIGNTNTYVFYIIIISLYL